MDVVRKAVESIRGRIDVETAEGSGTTFQISIPLSLSLVDGFMVALGDNLYIMPMDLVLETMELPSAAQRAVMPNGSLQVRDRLIPCLDLRKVLGVAEPEPRVQHVVVFKYGGTGVGLIVDRLHGEIKTVVKPLGHLYRNVACISGSSILGDGSIALFLETGKLIETSKVLKHGAFTA
jgi:two-component system chemotaxis sensor kinase CheA